MFAAAAPVRSVPVNPAQPSRPGPGQPTETGLALRLRAEGVVSGDALVRALAVQRRHGGRLTDILLTQGMAAAGRLYAAMARHWQVPRVDPVALPPDPGLVERYGAARALRHGVLPWRRLGPVVHVVVAHPTDFHRHRAALEECLGPVAMALSPPAAIEAATLAVAGPALARAAELSVPAQDSSRTWGGAGLWRWLAAAAAAILLVATHMPQVLVLALTGWTVLTLVLCTGLRAAAALAALRPAPPAAPPPVIARLPVVSVMVALYREADIAPRLVRRLERLDYPRDLLDIVLVVEAGDHLTRDALARAGLPPWMRVVAVPPGRVKTKPRALNYALGLCRGSIVGVYDAEDAPAPDQIARVVQRFHECPPQVACLQGMLDFYNPRANWMARAFTMEYAAWFRMVLPGVDRLRLAVPLGGTTLFFRRAVLEQVGAWDAWNVTEDADLGIRLTRQGFRTELIETVTGEEANCRPWPWVKQRSRWIKGYMMTWAVHMRRPRDLWRDLGPRGFLGFQVMFLGTLTQFLLAPLLWSFLLVPFGLAHPVATALPPPAFAAMIGLFLLTEAVNLAVGWVGLRRAGHRFSPLWLLALHAYFPLATLAAYKAAWEMVTNPFYWDKTAHGLSDAAAGPAAPQEPARLSRAEALDRARRLHPSLLPGAAPRTPRPPLLRRRAPPVAAE
ncbi:MAG: glycosyltransferase [Paracoccaceae bacterium]|nr:MAG: glycosyltransferase [Paracoccaceae bacterium]